MKNVFSTTIGGIGLQTSSSNLSTSTISYQLGNFIENYTLPSSTWTDISKLAYTTTPETTKINDGDLNTYEQFQQTTTTATEVVRIILNTPLQGGEIATKFGFWVDGGTGYFRIEYSKDNASTWATLYEFNTTSTTEFQLSNLRKILPEKITHFRVLLWNNTSGKTTYGRVYEFNVWDFRQAKLANTRIEIPHSTSFNNITNAFTLEAWINPYNITGKYRTILCKNDWTSDSNYSYLLQVSDKGELYCKFANTFGWEYYAKSAPNTIQPNNWYHVAAVYDGSILKLFANGMLVAYANANGYVRTNTYPVRIGKFNRGNRCPFDGIIDEVRISNSVRYTSNFTPSTSEFTSDSDTIGLWHFNETSGTTVNDSSSNGNNGTIKYGRLVPSGKFSYGVRFYGQVFDGDDMYADSRSDEDFSTYGTTITTTSTTWEDKFTIDLGSESEDIIVNPNGIRMAFVTKLSLWNNGSNTTWVKFVGSPDGVNWSDIIQWSQYGTGEAIQWAYFNPLYRYIKCQMKVNGNTGNLRIYEMYPVA
jgi:hypothetical protein